ncbi:hypothetical protein JTB14_032391 [Gonioctena quinquepunctata]|nr:hypothetical protein JTB14_032391 [Gonioctena quinquepunctata]
MPCCFVPLCNSGTVSERKMRKEQNNPVPNFFCPPNEEARMIWELNIRRPDKPLGIKDRVCSKHFEDGLIIHNYSFIIHGKTVALPRRATLVPGAVPTKFPEYPRNYTAQRRWKEKTSSKKKSQIVDEKNKTDPIPSASADEPIHDIRDPETVQTLYAPQEKKDQIEDKKIKIDEPLPSASADEPIHDIRDPKTEPGVQTVMDTNEMKPNDSNVLIHESKSWHHLKAQNLKLPHGWVVCPILDNGKQVLAHINSKIQIDKSITFEGRSITEVILRGITSHDVKFKREIQNITEAQDILNAIHLENVGESTSFAEEPCSIACKGAADKRRKSEEPCSIACKSAVDKRRKRSRIKLLTQSSPSLFW